MKLTASREIFVVEDDPDDIFLYRRAFASLIDPDRVRFLRNGEELVSYCNRLVGSQRRPDEDTEPEQELPGLILLDIKMPKKSGLEVLEWFRRQEILRRIPIIILSSSQARSDINAAYELGVNAYVVKPLIFAEMQKTIDHICNFWLKTITPPSYH